MDKQKAAPKKKKGPIRTEAVVPFVIFCLLIVLYFTLFFDGHLRRGLEWGATQANGAEVNIGSLRTSFLKGTFAMGKIEVTDPKTPETNRLELGSVRFQFLWDALLRAKFVVDLASIDGIELGTTRKSPGKVLPPPAPSQPGVSNFLAAAKERVSTTALAGVGKILEGLDPTQALGTVGELKSVTQINGLKTNLSTKEAEWQATLAKIPGEKDFADLQSRINAIPTGGGNPAEIAQRAGTVKTLIDETQAKISAVQTMGTSLTGDIDGFQKSIGSIDGWIKADREELEKKLKIPSIDAKGLSEQLLGTSVLSKLQQVEHYVALARKYMPPKKAEMKTPAKPRRSEGEDYEFPVTRGYPRFWLKKAQISTQGEHSAVAGGDIAGQILDVTTNPIMVGRPAVLNAQGDFPKRDIRNALVRIEIDHSGEVPVETLKASVGNFPMGRQILSESEALKFGFEKAQATSGISAVVRGDIIEMKLESSFQNVTYQVSAQSKLLESTFQSVLRELPKLEMNATVKGPWSALEFSVDSNLGRALQAGFGKQLQAKLSEARKKLDDMIQAQVAKPKQELTSRYAETRTKYTGEVEKRKKQAEGIKSQAEAKLKTLTSQGSGAQQKAKDLIKKKLPF